VHIKKEDLSREQVIMSSLWRPRSSESSC